MFGEGAKPTIVVVDDAPEVRSLVRSRLRLSGLLDVVGEAGDGAAAIELVGRLRPALVLLDLSMPGVDGLEALPQLVRISPETRVVMYSGFQEAGLAHRALELGASAFLEKSTALDGLAADLVAVLDGTEPTRRTSTLPAQEADAERRVLAEHLERFREVFDDAAIGMATVTLAGQLVRANRALSALLGRRPDELVGIPYSDVAGAGAPELARLVEGLLAGSTAAAQLEHDLVDGDGGPRRVVATFSPVLDSNRSPLYLWVQVQDVTRQRGAEEELRVSQERLRLLVDTVQDYAIFMLDTDGTVETWNAGAQRIKGFTADDIIGRHFRTFYPPEMQAIRHPEHELELALRDGHYEEEGWRIRKDGSRFWANVVITAVHDADGRHVGFAKVTRDITERRQLLEDQAHFLSITAHELRTPVGVLGGTAQMLAEHWADLEEGERTELLEGMTSSAARLRRLLDDLLTASRLQSSRLELDRRPVEVGPVVTECVHTAQRGHPGVPIGADVAPGLVVDGDPGRLGQLVDNLVGNALVHGTPPVVVTAEGDHDSVRIRVRDAGTGVPDAVRPRLFERFATGRRAGGTGLGLFIVRQLAKAHGGDAWYRLPEGGDAGEFVVELPRVVVPSEGGPDDTPAQ